MNRDEIRIYLDSFVNFEKAKQFKLEQFNLDRMFELLRRLGNPQKDLKVIHVAGSKGKGSTSVFIAHILKEAGFRVGLYTSPHLSDVSERIRFLDLKRIYPENQNDIFKDQISDEELSAILIGIKPVLESLRQTDDFGTLSYFEVLTAISFVYFKKMSTDFVVLETGLGGRLDATNTTDSWMCVITPISFEHADILGNTIEKIAEEKAQIIKSTTKHVVVSVQEKNTREVIIKRCKTFEIIPDFVSDRLELSMISRSPQKQLCKLKGLKQSYENLEMKLLGRHQGLNAATAIGAIETICSLGYSISDQAIYDGIKHSFWPGRFEVFEHNPVFILDGAHNEASAKALVETFKEIFPNKKVLLILGMSRDKDHEGVCRALSEITETLILTKSQSSRAADLDLDKAQKYFMNAKCFKSQNVNQAILLGLRNINQDKIILIAGSLFVVADARPVMFTSR